MCHGWAADCAIPPLTTDLATVIAEGAGDTANDDDANFIVGGADALVTGLTQTAVEDLVTAPDDTTFRLNDLDNRADANSGFAVAIAHKNTMSVYCLARLWVRFCRPRLQRPSLTGQQNCVSYVVRLLKPHWISHCGLNFLPRRLA